MAHSDLWIAGDDAYKGPAGDSHGSLLTPIAGKNLDVQEDAFNFYQSSCRCARQPSPTCCCWDCWSADWLLRGGSISIECTFGELVGRWGVLWRKLTCSTEHAARIIEAICRLHNICVAQRAPITGPGRRGQPAAAHAADEDGPMVDVPELGGASEEPSARPRRARAQSASAARMQQRRHDLRDALHAVGMVRPPRSTYSSRSLASRARAWRGGAQ